jgi:hypothetical protein
VTQRNALVCIVCNKQPEDIGTGFHEEWEPAQPYGATMFSSYGQYGSTVFDPQDGSQIRINVCDECLVAKRDAVWHAKYVRQRELTVFSEPWNPNKDSEE